MTVKRYDDDGMKQNNDDDCDESIIDNDEEIEQEDTDTDGDNEAVCPPTPKSQRSLGEIQ